MKALQLLLVVIALSLSACGGPPKPQQPLLNVSVQEIAQMRNADELHKLLVQLRADLQGVRPESRPDAYTALAALESQLVSVTSDRLSKVFADARTAAGAVPLPTLAAEEQKARAVTAVSADKWAPVLAQLAQERAHTQQALASLGAQAQDGATEAELRLALFQQLYDLSGHQQWLNQKDALVTQLLTEIRGAREQGRLDAALQAKIALVRGARPDDATLLDEMLDVDVRIHEQGFFKALADGDPDQAYGTFLAMAESPDFPRIREKLAGTSQRMAELFVALADDSVQDPANLSQSYRWYQQARTLRAKLGLAAQTGTGELLMREQLQNALHRAKEQHGYPVALAYLYMLDDLEPNHRDRRREIKEAEEILRQLALKKVSTTVFKNSALRHDYGNVMSSSITQQLFNKVPNDVRIIEREQYEAIVREKSLGGGGTSELKAVDYLITGSVLESKVDSAETTGKKLLRVEVGKETIPNPAYVTWLELPERQRNKLEKPSATLEVAKQENISVSITRHRKVGIFSVSYRLVDADSGKVLFPDTITLDDQHEDDSTEGVEMGDFEMPFKLAKLPSDVEILDGLARRISEEIGTRLVQQLEHQERRYLKLADAAAANSHCLDEVGNLGRALMILALKDQDGDSVRARYTQQALRCGV